MRRALVLLVALAARPALAAETTLRWEAIPGAVSYELQIAADRGFASVVETKSVPATRARWTPPADRPYFWRVRALDVAGNPGDFSEPGLTRPPPPPKPIAPAKGASAKAPVRLQWAGNEWIRSYRVEVARNAAFTKQVKVYGSASWDAGAATAEWTLASVAEGEHYWRVGGIDVTGATVAPGPASRFVIAPAVVAVAPTPEPTPEPTSIATAIPTPEPSPIATSIATPAPTPVEPAPTPTAAPVQNRKWLAGGSVGWFSNLGEVASFAPEIEASRSVTRSLAISVGAGWYASEQKASPVTASLRAVPFSASLLWRAPLRGFTAYGGGGPEVTWLSARVTAPTQPALAKSDVRLALALRGGVERDVGVGRAFVEVGAAAGERGEGLVKTAPLGFRAAAGWRMRIR